MKDWSIMLRKMVMRLLDFCLCNQFLLCILQGMMYFLKQHTINLTWRFICQGNDYTVAANWYLEICRFNIV